MKSTVAVVAALLLAHLAQAQMQPAVSPFAGSEALGSYEVEFQRLMYGGLKAGVVESTAAEGRLLSRLFKKPEAKSALEVFRSYQKEIAAAGFKILFTAEGARDAQKLVRALYGRDGNNISKRPYRKGGKVIPGGFTDRIATFPECYLVAEKKQADGIYYVAVVIGRDENNYYAIDELKTEAMETGTVTLTLERLKTAIESEGKAAVYDLFFAVGSADILPTSQSALKVIAGYLAAEPSRRFYVVGHTDDTGTLEANLSLSERRAAAVVQALTAQHGAAAGRVTAKGVGPLAPASTNQSEAGRALNRRVELVLRLEN